MARRSALLALVTACSVLTPMVARADPDPKVQGATGLDTALEQEAVGATTTPGGSDPLPDAIAVTPAYGADWASADDIQAAVGDVTMSMDRCPEKTLGDDNRVVRVQLSKPDFETGPIVNALLLRAAKFAWENCPQPFLPLGFAQPTSQFHHDVSEIDIYLPDGTKGFSGSLGMYGRGDQAYAPGSRYVWQHLADEKTAHDRQVADQAQQAAQAQQIAHAQQAAQASGAQQPFSSANPFDLIAVQLKILGFLIKWGFIIGIGYWFWSKREDILSWYYGLTPHPASGMVHSRVDGGGPLDGELFAEIMRQVPGSPVEQRVRADQARQLAAMARAAAETRLRELEKLKAKAVEEAAFIRAQEDLRSAVETHEMAMARLDALRKWRGRNVG